MDSETIDKIGQLAVGARGPFEHLDGSMVQFVPEGMKPYKMESDRAKGTFYFTEVDSIAEYVNTYKHHDGRPVALCDRDAGEVRVILNWHDPVSQAPVTPSSEGETELLIRPNSGDHVARFVPKFDDRFAAWNNLNERRIKQIDFAEFLEDRASEIVEPDAARILEVARELEVHRNATFKSGQKLHSGDYSFQITQESRAQTKHAVEIPSSFKVRTPIYAGQPATDINFALRYRPADEGIFFTLVMQNRSELLVEAFDGMRSQIAAKTGLTVLQASLDNCRLEQ